MTMPPGNSKMTRFSLSANKIMLMCLNNLIFILFFTSVCSCCFFFIKKRKEKTKKQKHRLMKHFCFLFLRSKQLQFS